MKKLLNYNFLIVIQEHGENISGSELHSILSEIDTNNNGQVELEEYLQVKHHGLIS